MEGKSINFSYGCELEWSDVDRRVDIPAELGSWEGPKIAGYYMGSEIDIVNTKGKWKGVGTDPLCMTCQVGGEIHTQPSRFIETQLFRVMRILDLFPVANAACPNHGHIHVGVPGLLQDLELLKNVFRYTRINQENLIAACCGYTQEDAKEIESSDLMDWVKQYLLVGDGKHITEELFDRVEKAESVAQVLKALETVPCEDWEWVSGKVTETPGSHRTAVNLFNLTKGETIEFRIFRSTTNPVELWSCLKFVRRYMEEALKGAEGKKVYYILQEGKFKFPKLNFNYGLAKGWQSTRQTKGRCGPFKKYTGFCEISEDPIILKEGKDLSPFEDGLNDIRHLCSLDFMGIDFMGERTC